MKFRLKQVSDPPTGGEQKTSPETDSALSSLHSDRAALVPDCERSSLLAWASELAEQAIVLPQSITYEETPLRIVTTDRVSFYATHYLGTVSFARLNRATGGWGMWIPEWWSDREREAIGALHALRTAMKDAGH